MTSSEFSRRWQVRWRRRFDSTFLDYRHSFDQCYIGFAPSADIRLSTDSRREQPTPDIEKLSCDRKSFALAALTTAQS